MRYLLITIICLMMLHGCAQADCGGLSPELQKAYNQLKHDGFDVSCRKGL